MSKGRSSYSHICNYMCIKRDNVDKLKQQSRNQRSVFLLCDACVGRGERITGKRPILHFKSRHF